MRKAWSALLFFVVAVILLRIAATALEPYMPLIGGALTVIIVVVAALLGYRAIRFLSQR